ncbi:MAG: flagellar biosynthetic protein FliR [Bacteroidetes bacterium]|nr:flagellar biosynthetic protein FliR [Rhodothermia bacterium]MCX7906800.1 flagellar biosynthetic protein FliR [Bacteroidota bacterium]MDW8285209.1 flagellar biosynthetic protein FliR [Bacteroidota bacterium]
MEWTTEYLVRWFLVVVRISGLLLAAPFWGMAFYPGRVRLLLAFGLGLFFAAQAPGSSGAELSALLSSSYVTTLLSIAREFLVGLCLGFAGRLLFEGIRMAGDFAGVQIGLGLANVFDPTAQEQGNVLAQFWFLLATLMFLLLDGHHLYMRALSFSFALIPLGGAVMPDTGLFLRLATGMFAIGLQLAAPFWVVMLLLDALMALYSRLAPQSNIFLLSLSLKVLVGLLLAWLLVPMLFQAIPLVLERLDDWLERILAGLAPR